MKRHAFQLSDRKILFPNSEYKACELGNQKKTYAFGNLLGGDKKHFVTLGEQIKLSHGLSGSRVSTRSKRGSLFCPAETSDRPQIENELAKKKKTFFLFKKKKKKKACFVGGGGEI